MASLFLYPMVNSQFLVYLYSQQLITLSLKHLSLIFTFIPNLLGASSQGLFLIPPYFPDL